MPSKEMIALCSTMKDMIDRGFVAKFDGEIDHIVLRDTIETAQKNMQQIPNVWYESVVLNEVEGELCIPDNHRDDAVIIYFHGGGLICGNAFSSRGYAGIIGTEANLPVYTLTYGLAPENPYPQGINDCFEAYKAVLDRHPNLPIFLIGESGGGYLSLTTTLKAKDEGIKLPAGIIPYSPVIDMSNTLDRSANDGRDFTVTQEGLDTLRTLYLQDDSLDVKDSYISPMFGDYSNFPPMLLAWDESETLAKDSEFLADKARSLGVEVHAKSYPDCFHAFAIVGKGTPESAEILVDTIQFIEKLI